MSFFEAHRHSTVSASIGIAVGGAFWGIYWIPLRALDSAGLSGAWAGIGLYVAAIALATPWLWAARHRLQKRFLTVLFVGIAMGSGMGLFSTAVVLTEVVRATLLFYLAPVWATIAGLFFLGERLTLARIIALILGLVGAAILLGIGDTLPIPSNLGDWMAFASGLTFAVGSLFVYRMKAVSITEQSLGFMMGAIISSLAIIGLGILWGLPELGSLPTTADLAALLPTLGWGGLLVLGLVFTVIWPAKVLSPGRVSLLLMGEIIVGAVTSMIWAGEALVSRELIGGVLIISAGLVEVFGNKPNDASGA